MSKLISMFVALVIALSFIGSAFAETPTVQQVAADVVRCGTTIHLEGTARVQYGSTNNAPYLVHYVLRNEQGYSANPQVVVIIASRQNNTRFFILDRFQIVGPGGVVSVHQAKYNFLWVDGQLTVNNVQVTDICR